VDAGYNICPRAMGGESLCKKSRDLQIRPSASGSGTHTRHLEMHDAASQAGVGGGSETGTATTSTGVMVKFAAPMKKRMADAAVVGVFLDHQSYGFAVAPGVQAIVAAAVKAAAGYGPASIFDVGNYLQCATTVGNAVDCTAAAYRLADMGPDGVFALATLRGGDALTDDWKCAGTRRKYYDLNISCLEVFAVVGLGQATVHLSNRCIVFAKHEGNSENATSIISKLELLPRKNFPGTSRRPHPCHRLGSSHAQHRQPVHFGHHLPSRRALVGLRRAPNRHCPEEAPSNSRNHRGAEELAEDARPGTSFRRRRQRPTYSQDNEARRSRGHA
jgi:hypothetical protein